MSRLKRLRADNNGLYGVALTRLSSLVLLSLAHNRIELLCGMEYLHNLVNLNLTDNMISGTHRCG
jgi:Leucine-rich repeat (LRR) protein